MRKRGRKMQIEMGTLRFAGVALVLASLAMVGGTAGAQDRPGPGQRCPPACDIDITVPADRGPPRLGNPAQERTSVKPGERIVFTTPRGAGAPRLTLVFEKDSPFVDRDGNTLYVLELPPGRRPLPVREDRAACAPPDGCKYTVIDRGNPTRKPLDPWIIIDR